MLLELSIYTGISTVATIGPVYKIRKGLAKLFKLPAIGWTFSMAYGLAVAWLLLNIFSFRSSVAGLANLASSILFSVWLFLEHKKLQSEKQAA